jgi:glycine betaine catabolism B
VTRWFTSCTTRLFQLLVLPFALFAAVSVIAQISPAEHAQHHPGQSAGGTNSSIASGMGGMMEGMDEMMKGMGVPPQKELYPSLMALPELTPEKRREVEQRASERMQVGTKLMGQALDALHAQITMRRCTKPRCNFAKASLSSRAASPRAAR